MPVNASGRESGADMLGRRREMDISAEKRRARGAFLGDICTMSVLDISPPSEI